MVSLFKNTTVHNNIDRVHKLHLNASGEPAGILVPFWFAVYILLDRTEMVGWILNEYVLLFLLE